MQVLTLILVITLPSFAPNFLGDLLGNLHLPPRYGLASLRTTQSTRFDTLWVKDPSSPRDLLYRGPRLARLSQGPLFALGPHLLQSLLLQLVRPRFMQPPCLSLTSLAWPQLPLLWPAPLSSLVRQSLQPLALLAPRLQPQHWGPGVADPNRFLGSRILKP